uniref:KH_dom_type_1 domain-containing protein n=1 Tax=Trichuris muris TaxID=70415 RepID=A0A5S6R2I4_TRIMR
MASLVYSPLTVRVRERIERLRFIENPINQGVELPEMSDEQAVSGPVVGEQAVPYGTDYQSDPVSYAQSAAMAETQSANGFDSASMSLSVQNNTANELLELKTEVEMVPGNLVHARRLLEREIDMLQSGPEPEYLDVDGNSQPIRLMRKVLVPVQRNPRFNFVGKLLGPGGKTLQGLIHQTKCRIYVLGRGSSRDKSKEEDLINSGDPKYAHLKDPLHVRIEVVAPAPIAYQRLAHALHELHYYLQPVRDDIVQQQLAEIAYGPHGGMGGRGRGRMGSPSMRSMMRGGGGPMRGRGMPPHPMGGPMHQPPAPNQQSPNPSGGYTAYPGGGYASYQPNVTAYGNTPVSPSPAVASASPSTPTNMPAQPATLPGTPMPPAGSYPAAYNYGYAGYPYSGYPTAGAQFPAPIQQTAAGKTPVEPRRGSARVAPY